ncbi:MAG TPA: response regulator [Kofleriaceae bacterium]|jgi:CheY-like chemotaxis protein|nr:response regulator [Kofleriaceae bacterium]
MVLRLLIADDNPDDARLIAFAMKRAGYAFEWQRVEDETGFARELPGADLVICDYSMPKFSPVRALEMIRASGLGTPLLLVSGSVSAETANRLVALGAVGYLLKDRLDRLGPAVRQALARVAAEPR